MKVTEYAFTEEHFQQIKLIWDQLAQVQDKILVRVNFQGETLFDPWAKKGAFYINKIENVKLFEIITNNSINPNKYLHELDLEKTSFNCSFHPEFISIDKFLKHIHIMKEAGCNVFANLVGTPHNLKKIKKFFKIFKKNGIILKLQGYFSPNWYMREGYPWDFNVKERKILEHYFDSKEEYEYMTELKETKGLDCYAGVDMVNIFLDGAVKRCFTGDIGSVTDLISGKVSLKNEAYPCHEHVCTCNAHLIGIKTFREKYRLSPVFVDNYERTRNL